MAEAGPDPLVSVLVPTFEVAPWLAAALDSALGQSLRDLEVVVVDDGSRDGSAAIAEVMAVRDPRLRVVRHPINRGSAAARNEALEHARGRWIAVLDGDDRMEPERLARLVATAEAVGADWIADDQWIEAEGRPWPPARLLFAEPAGASRLDPAHFLDRDPPETIGYGTLKPVVRRAFLEAHGIRWRPEAARSDDFLFTIDCMAAGAACWLFNEPLYRYRLRPASQVTSLAPQETIERMLEAHALAEQRLAGHGDRRVAAALARRRARIEEARLYRRTLEDARRGAVSEVVRTLWQRPGLVPLMARGLVEAGRRRLVGGRLPTLADRSLFRPRLG